MRWLLTLSLLLSALAAQAGAPAVAETVVTYKAGKDSVKAVLCRPDGKGAFPAVVVVHGDFGPTKWVKEQARRLAGKGYVVLAIDLYRGSLPKDVEEAHILERGLPENRVQADLKAAVDLLTARPDVRKEAIGILGWDMGGGHALDGAVRDGRLRAVVICYGRVPTEAKSLATLQGSVLALFAGKDEGISEATREQFRAAMKKAGKRLAGLHVYRDCDNGFMDPTSPYLTGRPDAAVIADAWARIEKYLAEELRR
jgi:carboxymethylenebutenolidase